MTSMSVDYPLDPRRVETSLGTVECASSGEGPAILCLHGAMGGYDQSLILARVLGPAGYRYVAMSRPGYLGTPLALGASCEQQADLCAALLDALGVERAAVMAVSGGGPTAITFALRHASRCWALVLASAPVRPMVTRPPASFHVMKLLARWRWFARKMERKAMEEPEAMAARSITNPELLAQTIADEPAWELLRDLQQSTMNRMVDRLVGTDNDIRVAAHADFELEAICVPTLVVQGTDDPLVPFETNGKEIARRVPGAELVPLDGGEHAAIFSHRNLARQRVEAFLGRHAPSGSQNE